MIKIFFLAKMSIPDFSVICACTSNYGIGKDNTIPWRIKTDMDYFKEKTAGAVVIMGRKTWESIPAKFRPLPGRRNIIISNTLKEAETYSSLKECLEKLGEEQVTTKIFVIGGEKVYSEAIQYNECKHIYLTVIEKDIECDRFFPQFDKEVYILKSMNRQKEKDYEFRFELYSRRDKLYE